MYDCCHVVGGGGVCCGFIVKKAIAKISAAIHNRIRPIPTMISTAPIRSSIPVVENNPTFVFAERCLSERLKR